MGVCPSGRVSGMPSRRIRTLRTPNAARAPNPRTAMRGSCVGLFRLATETPGTSSSVSSAERFRCPGRRLSGIRRVTANGSSSGDRATSRVTVTTTGGSVVGVVDSCALACAAKRTSAAQRAPEDRGSAPDSPARRNRECRFLGPRSSFTQRLTGCPAMSRMDSSPMASARNPASIALRSPTITTANLDGSTYCCATRCTSATVTSSMRCTYEL